MTRDEIKNTPELVDFLLDECVIADSRRKLHKRIDEICSLAIKALEQEPSRSEKSNKWIPVGEMLPEENETVIASTDYGVYPEARCSKEDGWEWAYEAGADYWVKFKGVTAWMPLPEPYKAESEGKE